ncbi:ATP-binding protein [Streptomyces sp. NPDC005551]|uniref:ATP-binding protein n=1 Tax=Streptomyces sp. NPDC005551 TaxID=3364725 RepID=UPI0036C5BA28
MEYVSCVPRKRWNLPFSAEPEEVRALRRLVRLHLSLWGLPDVIDTAQSCVTELVSNVITHVGAGTPATLTVSMNGTYVRIEVQDPDARALPTLVCAGAEAEGGRGMALVDALADRWGVLLHADRKITWCELATRLNSSGGHSQHAPVARAEAILSHYGAAQLPRAKAPSVLSEATGKEVAIHVIVDLLHWLQAHGVDAGEVVERAHMHFEPLGR